MSLRAVAGGNPQGVIEKVEFDLEGARAIWNRRGRQSARGDVQRDVPGMVQPGFAREPDLADDLGPQLQRFASLTPRRGRQFRPGDLRGAAHA